MNEPLFSKEELNEYFEEAAKNGDHFVADWSPPYGRKFQSMQGDFMVNIPTLTIVVNSKNKRESIEKVLVELQKIDGLEYFELDSDYIDVIE